MTKKRQMLPKTAILCLFLALGGCATASTNALTHTEKTQGWQLLFDGKDLAGWRGYKKPTAPSQWFVEDGAITLNASGGDLMTDAEFGDFELAFDWKIAPNGNSGLIYLVKENDAAPNTYSTGPEWQVIDDEGHPDGRIASHRAGGIYDLVIPKANVVSPVGEWNQARLIVHDSRIEHWVNGKLVAQSTYGDDAWRARVAGSKFKPMPLFGKANSGHIALQDHNGDRVWYRNIKIRSLAKAG